MRSVGIDIGRYSIKIAEIEAENSVFIVKDFSEIPFSSDITKDPYIQTLEVLRKIANHYDPNNTKFCVALPQSSICMRYKNFPFKERFKVIRSIAFELEDDIPFDQDEAVFDAKILSQKAHSSEVLAVATPHVHVHQLLQLCEEAGIDPDIISMEAAAIANLVEKWWGSPKDLSEPRDKRSESSQESEEGADFDQKKDLGAVKILLHIGHSKTIVSAYSDSTLVATHSISFGGADIIREIANKYSLSYPEALKTFKDKGFLLTSHKAATKDQIFFSDTIANSLKTLTNETKRFLLSLHSDFQYELDSIHTAGGVSQLLNLGAYLTQQFEVAVNPYIHASQEKLVNRIGNKEAVFYRGGLAIGLALEGAKQARNPAINFRQGELGKQGQLWTQFYERWGKTLQISAIALLCLFIYAPLKSYLSSELYNEATKKLKDQAKKENLRGRSATPGNIDKYVKSERAKFKARSKLSQLEKVDSSIDFLDKFSKSIPDAKNIQLDITKLEIKEENVLLEGFVTNASQLSGLESSLKKLSISGDLEKRNSSSKVKVGKVNFAYAFEISRKKATQ